MKNFFQRIKCMVLGHKYGKDFYFMRFRCRMCKRCYKVIEILTKDQSQDTRPSNYDPR